MARYITTTLPYVNAVPHVGHALEYVQADAYTRAVRLREEAFFNTGVDEHGQKVYEKACEKGIDPQRYVDELAPQFDALKTTLDLSYDAFIRTTSPAHKAAAQEFWHRCAAAGDIYKKEYQVKYCVGCELEKTDSELVDGRCPLHPNLDLEIRKEENYFFRLSSFNEKLRTLYDSQPDFVVPSYRLNEIRSLIEGEGLQDFSISRVAKKMPWGVPVPGDDTQVMYVWFDALVNYVSTLGWPSDEERFKKWWPVIQFAGKDQVRQQAAMWQAMLMSAGLEPSRQIMIHGFVTIDGQKISKSLGNVIAPQALVDRYGTDATRYFLLRHVHPFEDSDVSWKKFDEWYTGGLTNGLGNLVARVMKLAEEYLKDPVVFGGEDTKLGREFTEEIDAFKFNEAMDFVFVKVAEADAFMTNYEPYKHIKSDDSVESENARRDIESLVRQLVTIAAHLAPAMFSTSEKILNAIRKNKKPQNLFPRLP